MTVKIENWEDLSRCVSGTHRLEIDTHYGCGWIVDKENEENEHYLSTHTFYDSMYKHSTVILQKYGFDVELISWG